MGILLLIMKNCHFLLKTLQVDDKQSCKVRRLVRSPVTAKYVSKEERDQTEQTLDTQKGN